MREVISDSELVWETLNGVAKPWDVFVEAIVTRENLPSWDRIWDDFVQEETRRGLVQGNSSTSREDEENVDLIAKGKKKFKKGPKKGGAKKQDGQKKDLITVKCFSCQNIGHYVGHCPQNKKKSSSRQQLQQRLRSLQLDLRESFLSALGMLIEREHPSSPVQILILRGSIPC